MSSPSFKGKVGKGKGKYKSSKGKGKGERIVTVSNGTDARHQRTSDRRAVIKQKMLSTVLPKIADLSIDGSDTLFDVLSQGAKLTQADVKKFLGKPTADRKRLVLIHYKARWESDPEFREIWPADRTELTNALKEWSNRQFVERSSTLADSPQESKLSGGRISTRPSPVPDAGGSGGKTRDLGRAEQAAPVSTRYSGTRSSASKLSQEKSAERHVTPRTTPDSAAYKRSQTRSPDEAMRAGRSSAHRQTSCVKLPPPRTSPVPTPSCNSVILLPPPPSQNDRLASGDGNLSIVVPSEVLAQVNQSIVRINGEQSKGAARVTEAGREQWDKVVCCIAIVATAQVYQISVSGRMQKDTRMIVSAKPQHGSRAANGFNLCADSVAIFHMPDSTQAGNVDMSSNVMFY